MAIRIGHLADSALIARKLMACSMVVCASPDYLRANGTPGSVDDLRRHNCLGYTHSRIAGMQQWLFGEKGHVPAPISGNLQASHGDALLAAAIAGQGVLYQPTFLVDEAVQSSALKTLVLDHPPVVMGDVYAVYPASNQRLAKVLAPVNFLAERWGNVAGSSAAAV